MPWALLQCFAAVVGRALDILAVIAILLFSDMFSFKLFTLNLWK